MAFSLEFQKFFLITRTIFSNSRSEQFWQQIPGLVTTSNSILSDIFTQMSSALWSIFYSVKTTSIYKEIFFKTLCMELYWGYQDTQWHIIIYKAWCNYNTQSMRDREGWFYYSKTMWSKNGLHCSNLTSWPIKSIWNT